MKYRRILRYHGLRRPRLRASCLLYTVRCLPPSKLTSSPFQRVRQTWNKYNLYNLMSLKDPRNISRTFFQQKWTAKALTRGYHGEHIKERQWDRMFSRRLLSVVDMKPQYMATNDGSEQAAGRGSGLSTGQPKSVNKPTPYMQMTFAPMERRLDIAVFRALFASSARQARQMVVHGAVKVNGKKMVHPGYLLNPGDLFQVNPERVMTSTGKPRIRHEKTPYERKMRNLAKVEELIAEAKRRRELRQKELSEQTAGTRGKKQGGISEAALKAKNQRDLKALVLRAKAVVEAHHGKSKKKIVEVRALVRDIKDTISRAARRDSDVQQTGDAVHDLGVLVSKLELSKEDLTQKAVEDAEAARTGDRFVKPLLRLNEREREIVEKELQEEMENPLDYSKPYRTPWKPRPYMPAFAFIPRYLEVNQKICAAVYLRHPVARPGLAEVPTPFSETVNQLAFNWYLRRG
ncbi:putative rRNA binding protein [Lasiosphaeria hispida]|uniref:rRNA binding protein n=1 Tax=Lasiosphaeria hispida TaxID=260671 RepID=A0AAJ0HID8_9PEZI|nr:putative rRNA binding protein [Lasiosphaeria hispida]